MNQPLLKDFIATKKNGMSIQGAAALYHVSATTLWRRTKDSIPGKRGGHNAIFSQYDEGLSACLLLFFVAMKSLSKGWFMMCQYNCSPECR